MRIQDYRDLADVEDTMWYFPALHRRMILPLQGLKGKPAQVLDAGCGTGGLIRALSAVDPRWDVMGVDASAIACNFSRERTQKRVVEASVEALPFADRQFDAVTHADVIYMVQDPSRAIAEFARVLRPDGILVINTAAYQWMWSYHDDLIGTRHRFRRSELARLVESNGFELILSSYAVMLIFPLIIARRRLLVPDQPSSDVKPYPPLIESFCAAMDDLEYAALRRGLALPTGNSVFIAARRLA